MHLKIWFLQEITSKIFLITKTLKELLKKSVEELPSLHIGPLQNQRPLAPLLLISSYYLKKDSVSSIVLMLNNQEEDKVLEEHSMELLRIFAMIASVKEL